MQQGPFGEFGEPEWLIPPDVLDEVQSAWANEPGAEDLKSGRHVDHYQLTKIIGSGGMGVVWEALDLKHDRAVALKFIDEPTPTLISRFARERHILAQLNHPYIATLYDSGYLEDGSPYLAMEYVKGEAVDQYGHKCDLAARLRLFQKICEAVQAAHQGAVSHRDIKPSNILVGESAIPKLLDFGIAGEAEIKLDEGRPGPMTRDYASPEQAGCYPLITTQTDIYSLGVLLFTLVAGRQPYHIPDEATLEEIKSIIGERNPDAPSAVIGAPIAHLQAEDLDSIVLRAMRKDPTQRYPSAAHLAGDIASYFANEPVWAVLKAREEAGASAAGYRARKFLRRHATLVAAYAVVLLALSLGTITTAWQARIAKTEARIAIARQLAAQAPHLRTVSGISLQQAALLSIESLRRHATPEAEQALVGELALMPRPVATIAKGQAAAFAFDPKGRYLAVGYKNGDVRLWETGAWGDGERLGQHGGTVQTIEFDSTGERLVTTGADRAVRIWSVGARREAARIEPGSAVSGASFASGGRLVGVMSGNKVTVHDWESRRVMATMDQDELSAIAFSPDGNLLAMAGDARRTPLQIWDLKTMRVACEPPRAPGTIIRFSPNGRYLAAGSNAGWVALLDVTACKMTGSGTHRGDWGWIQAIAFHPSGQSFVTAGNDGTARVWDVPGVREISRMEYGPMSDISALDMGLGGMYVATAGGDAVKIWETLSGREIARIVNNDSCRSVRFAHGRNLVAVLGADSVTIWELTNGPVVSLAPTERHPLFSSSTDGRYLARDLDLYTVAVIEAATGRELFRNTEDDFVTEARLSADGRYLGVSSDNLHTMTVRELPGGRVVARISNRGVDSPFAFSLDGQYLVTPVDDDVTPLTGVRHLEIWGTTVGRRVAVIESSSLGAQKIAGLDFSPDARSLAILSARGGLWVYEWASETQGGREKFAVKDAPPSPQSLHFSPDGMYLLACGDDPAVRLWSAADGLRVAVHDGPSHAVACSFDPYGTRVAIAYKDGTISILDPGANFAITGTWQRPGVLHLAFSPDGKKLALDASDHSISLWDVATGKRLSETKYPEDLLAFAFRPDGKSVSALTEGDLGQSARPIWNWGGQDVIDEACARVTRNLTRPEWTALIGSEAYRNTCPLR